MSVSRLSLWKRRPIRTNGERMSVYLLFRMYLPVFFSFLCLSNPTASASPETGSFPPAIRNILDQGQITIAMTQNDMPPFYFRDASGNLSGIDVMLAKGIAERLGVRAVFNREATSFNGVVDLVVEGKADIAVSKLSRTLDRAKVIRYTDPYIVFRQGLLINRLGLAKKTQRMSEYEFIQNFTGKLGVIRASSYVGYARENFPAAEIVEYATWNEVVDAVFTGEILAAYRDEMEIKKIVRGRKDALVKLKTVLITDQEDPIAVAVAADKTHLLAWLNIYLQSCRLKLTPEKLLDMYPEIFHKSGDAP